MDSLTLLAEKLEPPSSLIVLGDFTCSGGREGTCEHPRHFLSTDAQTPLCQTRIVHLVPYILKVMRNPGVGSGRSSTEDLYMRPGLFIRELR